MRRIAISWSVLVALAAFPAAALAEDSPTGTDRENASEQCKKQRTAMGTAAFNQLYGTNANDRNAFGKCVSKNARDEQQERKAAHTNAAKQCKAERDDANFAASHDGKTFAQFYGTNKTGSNAYGKCVSQKAKANKEKADEADAARDAKTANAAKACRAEQKADPAAFKAKYGTNRNKSNAFGKCVSQKSRGGQGS